jgi:formyl-CoA transferase
MHQPDLAGSTPQALEGLRVLELGQLIAGPFAARTLGDFGADVIKVEPPESGDPLRSWRLLKDGTSVWWQVQSRNKRSITLDLRQPDAQEIVRGLLKESDVLVENFRPGTLEQWGLSPQELHRLNPGLIILRISGYGQDGPYRDKPGFGVVGEAMGGIRYLTAEPGRTPVRVGVSIGDTLAALHGVIGILMALHHRGKTGQGQVVDVALYEAVFNCMESLLPEYGEFKVIREPAGSSMPGIAPTNAYQCRDSSYVLIAANGDSIFKRLMQKIGRGDLASDPELAQNVGRVKRVEELDRVIGQWAADRTVDEVLRALDEAGVPAGKIYTAKDIAEDPHYAARGMVLKTKSKQGDPVLMPGITPKLSLTPGQIRLAAPGLGDDNEELLGGSN